MTYPYPIPGSGSTPVQSPENWFIAGNNCCSGNVWKDVEATVRIFLDYSQAMANVIGGNTITNVTLEITTVGDGMISIPSQSFQNNYKSFLVTGGAVGSQYGIEATATLTDGQVWIDHVTVNITDCGANVPAIAGGTLLSTLGPLAVSNTLYYYATGAQTVFHLNTPDRFGHTGTLADSNVLVYEGGGRQVPYDRYTVSVGANTITFNAPLVSGESAIFDLVSPPPPVPIIPPPILLNSGIIGTTLYYTALDGQTVFPLGTPDEFGSVGAMATNGVQVYRSGNRLTFMDSYTLDVENNQVLLVYPAGEGEPIIIELTKPLPISPPPLTGVRIGSEILSIPAMISAGDAFPVLSFTPDGSVMMMFVNGTAFFPPDAYTVSGRTLTWVSTLFSVPVGAAVIVVYTHA